MHVVIEIRNDESHRRQRGRLDEISTVGALGDAREADPSDVLAAIDAVISAAIRRIAVDLGANGR
jgi:hypothetical protein